MSFLLIHPPLVKPCEAPPGLAVLAGALGSRSIPFTILDANIEGILYLISLGSPVSDTWTKRALRHRAENLNAMRRGKLYANLDRYKRTIADLNRLLQVQGMKQGIHISFSDYQDGSRSPVRSDDLIEAYRHPEDNLFYPYFEERIPLLFDRFAPRTVGFSINFLSQALTAFAMIGYIRSRVPSVTIAAGGGLITSWMRNPCWSDPFSGIIDILVDGPGEGPLVELSGKEFTTGDQVPDYSALPLPSYLSPGFIMPFSASRGCYWQRCSFCPERAEGNPYAPLPPLETAQNLGKLTQFWDPALIHIVDNAMSPALLEAIVRNPPGAPWYGFARISELLAEPDFCVALKQSGCTMLKIGLESGSPRVLEEMDKGITLETASKALHILKKAGIATYCYLLFGTPFEKEEDAKMTLDFVVRHHESIGFLNLALFNLPAYGPDAAFLELNSFYEGDLGLYRPFRHPRGWERPAVRAFLEKRFKRHPAIAPIIRRDPPFFSSNHAPFFCMTGMT
ncbi:MAG: radical SAM protein [Syntrophales bacterium]|nr:radical SAM protein [Syntrophales bacterium]